MAAPPGEDDAELRFLLKGHLGCAGLWDFDPPKACFGRECSPLGRAVLWGAEYMEGDACSLAEDKVRFDRITSSEEAAAFNSAVERTPGGTEGLVELWNRARAHKNSGGRPPGDGPKRDATRLALVYALCIHASITDDEAAGAVALSEDLMVAHPKGMSPPTYPRAQDVLGRTSHPSFYRKGMSPPTYPRAQELRKAVRTARTARELLACTVGLRAVKELAEAAVKEACILHDKLTDGQIKESLFKSACLRLENLLATTRRTRGRLRKPLRNVAYVRQLWDDHRATVEDVAKRLEPPPS